uniref:ABM domain-containing protein n=1 Tax=Mycena chlorophos TaxID=658473 RepID=A0ABQ0KU81_MYCCL|nr:predicted protein [Mycena chlorophos]
MPSSNVTFAASATVHAQADKLDTVKAFFVDSANVAEKVNDTVQFFAIQYRNDTSKFRVFDTFRSDAERQTHLGGPVVGALNQHAPNLFTAAQADITPVSVVSNKVTAGVKPTVGVTLFVTPKPDQVDAFREFLVGAIPLVDQEDFTPFWYAVELADKSFGIIEFFADEASLEKHLAGGVKGALNQNADKFLTSLPEVKKIDVLSSYVKV